MSSFIEIGSEFWNVPIVDDRNDLFPSSTCWFVSGRSALKAIINKIHDCHSVAIPSWCCDSMIKPFLEAGFNVVFYPVYWDNGIKQIINLECDVVFLIDYFGYHNCAVDLDNYSGIVIRDITHSLFSKSYNDADYYFGSLRKWCGFWTGGFAWSQNNIDLSTNNTDDLGYSLLRKSAMELKEQYIIGNIEKKDYLELFTNAEELLNCLGVVQANSRDISLAFNLDVQKIKSVRNNNACIIRSAFPDLLIFPDINELDCPLFVPLYIPNGRRDDLKRVLIEQHIYCPVHWPVSRYHSLDDMTIQLYNNELSIVCDQRYSNSDIYRIVDALNAFWKEA